LKDNFVEKDKLSEVKAELDAKVESGTQNVKRAALDAKGRAYSTGKKKEAVARVWIKSGKGDILVNKKKFQDYFGRAALQSLVQQPFQITNSVGRFDVMCTIKGGGLSGQASALRHGISKALEIFNASYRPLLKQRGLLTRDARVVEPKRYGRPKARKGFQTSKR
jgi:small subunit ribosomal protein S9